MTFDLSPLTDGSASNAFFVSFYSYAQVVGALTAHSTTGDDAAAVAGLPTLDPSAGVGFGLTSGQAQALGLAGPSGRPDDDHVTLSSTEPWAFGQDAVGALEHEITEGVFGRIQSLGLSQTQFSILDLFRFSNTGAHDYSGGRDGATAVFGISSNLLSGFAFHNSFNAAGISDGSDLGDWNNTYADAFGFGGGGFPTAPSTTDLRELDIIGWTPPAAPLAGGDDFANSFTDTGAPFGQLSLGAATSGSLELLGDRDWFKVQLNPGADYVITLTANDGGGGSLDDPILRLHDANGALITSNDDANSSTFDSAMVVHTAGTYYLEAGSSFDDTPGSYTVTVQAGVSASTSGNDVMVTPVSGGTLMGGLGNDTIVGDTATDYLRGEAGDDVINGGSGFDDSNGNMGNDTIHGNAGDDYSVGGKDNDMLFGDAGDDIVWGNLGNDTCDGGSGNDQVRGGQGDDVIFGGSGNDFVSGDRGNDTLTGGSGADLFHDSQDAGIDKVMDFNIAEGDRVELDPGTTYAVSQVGADTVLDMGGGNQMILVGVQMTSLLPSSIFMG
jgi:Ca2+-binding RTX toxin-like protein